jgi:hypothetical protein
LQHAAGAGSSQKASVSGSRKYQFLWKILR